jgi:hypothetical protein
MIASLSPVNPLLHACAATNVHCASLPECKPEGRIPK